MVKRNTQEYLILALSAFASSTILIFAFIRYIREDWLIAIVDSAIALGMGMVFVYTYKTHRIKIPSIALSIFSAVAVTISIHIKGVDNVYWIYPAIVAAYYLLECHWASLLALLTMSFLAPVLYGELGFISFIAVLTTIFMTSIFGFFFSKSVREQHQKLSELATRDSLTSAGNRRAMDNRLQGVIAGQTRKASKVSLVLLDLDYFKKINDEYGHIIGDQVLINIVKIIEGRIRITDALYRFGGEEFVIVPLELDLEDAGKLAEQIRILVENNVLVPENPVTISLGVAEYQRDETSEKWLSRADEALYRAKSSGRNCVCLAD